MPEKSFTKQPKTVIVAASSSLRQEGSSSNDSKKKMVAKTTKGTGKNYTLKKVAL